MAHPLTQHPPNMIGFGAPATMSPLGFGFGQPSHSPAFGPPSPHPGLGFGFGSPATAQAGPSSLTSPYKRPPARASPAPSTPTHVKRSRRASSSPSTIHSSLPSPSLSKRRTDDDDTDSDPRARRIAGKLTKRIRKDVEPEPSASDGPDLGLLLASLPPTTHLPILLELLNENPSLAPRVLRSIPQPPLANCLETLERIAYKIGKAAGSWEPQEGYVASRRWNRVVEQVTTFTKTASTYIKFFTAAAQNGQSSPEPNTLFHLLHALTAHVLQILALVPADTPSDARPFLDLANLVLSNWTAWINALSDEVNNRGGMYPSGTVSTWVDGIEAISRTPEAPGQSAAPVSSLLSWGGPTTQPQVTSELVTGFRQALQPIRDRFVNELGWLVR